MGWFPGKKRENENKEKKEKWTLCSIHGTLYKGRWCLKCKEDNAVCPECGVSDYSLIKCYCGEDCFRCNYCGYDEPCICNYDLLTDEEIDRL